MRYRVGILDVAVAIVVLIAIVLPPRTTTVESAYARRAGSATQELRAKIAALEGALAENPADMKTAEELARVLEQVGQHDEALRVAGHALKQKSPETWRAHRAVSYAHAERLEIEAAEKHAELALKSCQAAGDLCDPQNRIRLRMYAEAISAARSASDEGIDPVKEPERFRRRIRELHPTVRVPAASRNQ